VFSGGGGASGVEQRLGSTFSRSPASASASAPSSAMDAAAEAAKALAAEAEMGFSGGGDARSEREGKRKCRVLERVCEWGVYEHNEASLDARKKTSDRVQPARCCFSRDGVMRTGPCFSP
jgi:hypothetical protein